MKDRVSVDGGAEDCIARYKSGESPLLFMSAENPKHPNTISKHASILSVGRRLFPVPSTQSAAITHHRLLHASALYRYVRSLFQILVRGVEARVVIAGFVRALVGVERRDTTVLLGLNQKVAGSSKASSAGPSKASTGGGVAGAGSLSGRGGGESTAGGGKRALVSGETGGDGEIDARRAEMVAVFEVTEALAEMLKPLEEMEVGCEVICEML